MKPGMKVEYRYYFCRYSRWRHNTPISAIEFPLLQLEVTKCYSLRQPAELGYKYFVGVSNTKILFTVDVEPERMPIAILQQDRWNAWGSGGAFVQNGSCCSFYSIIIYRKRAGGSDINIGSVINTLNRNMTRTQWYGYNWSDSLNI